MTSASADSSNDGELQEGSIVSRYRVVRKLGAGQMGEVYEAQRSGDGGRVALKVVRSINEHKTEPLRRFQREATLCAGLRHPNIVPVIDYGIWETKPFLVMPVLRGTDLDRTLDRTGPLAPEVAVAISLGAARGLKHAHDASIVHRDFKPANVFLDEGGDGSVTAVVCDFGVAKAIDGSADGGITATGAVVGTPLYMAPEQLLDSKRVDARCDVWSLGATLYHMLAGRAAFANVRTFGELLLAMRDERVPPLQALAPWVPPSLARVVHAMLLPAQRRIGTMADVISSLERIEPRLARLTSTSLVPMSTASKALVETQALVPKSANELTGPASEKADLPNEAGSDPFLGRTLNQRYVIISRLGLGGMGAVYEATDTNPTSGAPREVALKVMLFEHGTRDSEGVKRFLREAKAAARIASSYVTQVLDTGVDTTTGSAFIVMERLRGRDLAALLRREGCGLEPEPVISLFLHACDALAAAHALGIVHRDVKPSNLFVHEMGDETVVLKICDFGIAKQLTLGGAPEASAELTRTGGLLGSPLYMSPEQAKSAKNVDGRSDVFSLALSLHEALSGQRPWEGKTSMGEIIVAVCTEDVPPLNVAAPWVDPRIAAIIERGLKRDPAHRFQSVADFANALRPFGLGRPVRGAEVIGINPERVSSRMLPDSARSGALTNEPVSITASRPGRSVAGFIAVGAVLVCVLGGTGIYIAKTRLGHSTSTTTPSDSAEHAGLKPEPSAAPSASASSPHAILSFEPLLDAAPTATSTSTAGIAVPTKPVVGQKPNTPTPPPGVNSIASATPPKPSAAPSGSVGRGVTATDLP